MDEAIEEIKRRVISHYQTSNVPLLLSNFGKILRVEGIWPIEGEKRSLLELIESNRPEIGVIRDPKAKAFAIVVSQGNEAIAESAIAMRGDITFLENLPRPVILAFVVDKPDGKSIYLQTKPPFRYLVADQCPEGSVIIDDEFRKPGSFVDRPRDLSDEDISALADGIRKWATKHELTLDIFYEKDNRKADGGAPTARIPSPSGRTSFYRNTTALERLLAAQPDDIAARMVVPADIALTLSKMP
ncbi:hypothetical protein [Aquamicrobium terrae]